MKSTYTNAAEMARDRGIDGKRFRARLRRDLHEHHIFGSWRVVVGSDKHLLMDSVADEMVRADISRPSPRRI
ncbi:hypothetical protein [Ancylobacter sp.]|uniref:hypothetical protein n=1 Tax=Ancylobacter sp. TaxID=1872567 RepID=UPI003BAD1F1A